MSYKYIKSPSMQMASEAKSLTIDEYLQLEELLKQFKESHDRDTRVTIISEMKFYVERFSLESKVSIYYNNWLKDTIHSDSYMNLILTLRRLSKEAYEKEIFKNLL
ncbi:hypothetical protein GJV85_03495 [Sulfurimonas aquatica]|uniref:Uncharacterized protein n=1 Tax=Sulfurimonas aquatica TaxID=2672570 RepID=A0A975GCF2_9BACT|nr:hypothetical protein [Sulfurimonas aquatica]QSZ41214.1 hypothetical protein GJV85_03495 [Sulfurimonas aquatica]